MKIAFIGCGNMGEGILAGIRDQATCIVCEARSDRRAFLKKRYGVMVVDVPARAASAADVVLLAVKPQDLTSALEGLTAGPLFISIAAGISSGFIENKIGGKPRVVRTMPNLPAMIREGATALAAGKYATDRDLKTSVKIMKAVGATVVVKEKMIDAVTAVSGSGPAYVFLLVECWMKAARKLGFSENDAKALVCQTLLGSAHLLARSKDTPEVLRQKVTSKGGTTQAATDVFLARDIFGIYEAALKAAKQRAGELSK